jgi:hypothetical protein
VSAGTKERFAKAFADLNSADAVLLNAADTVANRTTELMGYESPSASVVALRHKARF